MFSSLLRRQRLILRTTLLLFFSAMLTSYASADFVQQGPKLVGAGASSFSFQGFSVAISADGNTAIVGGYGDASNIGAAWVYVRSNGTWTPQGDKLVGTGAVGTSQQGSVALSADGNTAIIGGFGDNGGTGAAWVFTRSNGVWSPQGGKLVGPGANGSAAVGKAVALSADGNTALVGGESDGSGIGAAWLFFRSGGSWSPGPKLVGTGASGGANQGHSVALSADGKTALIGGPRDNNRTGAAWVFTQNSGTWSQIGNKLVGAGAVTPSDQGLSVALSGDGKTAALGGWKDASEVGAVWVFSFDGTAWLPQGSKLVGTGNVGAAAQGYSVSLSGDGNTLLSAGYHDASNTGAVWAFNRTSGVWSQFGSKFVGALSQGQALQGSSTMLSADGSTAVVGGSVDNTNIGASWIWLRRLPHDFNGGGRSDILWRTNGGDLAMWLMNGASVTTVATLGNIGATWTPVGQRDFNADGKTDILWRESSGAIAMWLMNGASATTVASLGNIGANWTVAGTGDFNGDGKGDILWRDTSGAVAMWLMNGTSAATVASLGSVTANWSVVGTPDLNGDGKADILWRNTAGDLAVWLMNGTNALSTAVVGNIATNWSVAGTADFDGDGKGDILWRNTEGTNAIWLMNGAAAASVTLIGGVASNWSVASNGDYNGDGKGDILWRNTDGANYIWFMNGTTVTSVAAAGAVGPTWSVQNAGAN